MAALILGDGSGGLSGFGVLGSRSLIRGLPRGRLAMGDVVSGEGFGAELVELGLVDGELFSEDCAFCGISGTVEEEATGWFHLGVFWGSCCARGAFRHIKCDRGLSNYAIKLRIFYLMEPGRCSIMQPSSG